MTGHLLRDDDLSPDELVEVLDLSDRMKADRFGLQEHSLRSRSRGGPE